MFGIRDVERQQRMGIWHWLQPVVPGENRYTATGAVKTPHERRRGIRRIDAANKVQATAECVDIDTLAVRKEPRLTRVFLLVAAWSRTPAT